MTGALVGLGIAIVLLVIVAGIIIRTLLYRSESGFEISIGELIVGAFIIALVIVPSSLTVGYNMAWANTVSYNQYFNGWELLARQDPIPCSKDGPCAYEYDCDPYQVEVKDPDTCTGPSDNQTCTPNSHWETRYHSCPYVSTEYNYVVVTTLGDYTIAEHRFPDNPEVNRWVSWGDSDEWAYSSPIPYDVVGRAGVGSPQFWLDAQSRVSIGDPGPVTQRRSYDNYLLASDETILKQYSDKIEYFSKLGAMPRLRFDIAGYYSADKVYFVGYNPANPAEWEIIHAKLNAAFGTELQGDLHLVLVQNSAVLQDPDGYITALKASWQDTKVYGKDALSKNAVIVVIATSDGYTVSWVRAQTGMPVGNEYMEARIASIFAAQNTVPLTVNTILGRMTGTIYQETRSDGSIKTRVRGNHNDPNGVLERLLWGLDDPATRFTRISMTANDPTDNGTGFNFLKEQIRPSDGQMFGIAVVSFILSMVVWFIFAIVDLSKYVPFL